MSGVVYYMILCFSIIARPTNIADSLFSTGAMHHAGFILFELLDKVVDTLHLRGNVDALRTVGHALFASDTVIGLTQARYATVIPDEECATGPAVVLALG